MSGDTATEANPCWDGIATQAGCHRGRSILCQDRGRGRAKVPSRESWMHWNRTILVGGLLGALLVALLIVAYNWRATPRLEGQITEVRTLGMDDSSSVAIVNFQASNSSTYELSINRREMGIVDQSGNPREGRVLSVFDVQQLFQYFPALGGMRDEPLVDNTHLAPGESVRGLVAARFEIPKHELDARREIVLRTLDNKHRRTALRLESE